MTPIPRLPSLLAGAVVWLAMTPCLPAQTPPGADQAIRGGHVREGDRLYRALDPAGALEEYRAILAVDSTDHEALWKVARSEIDIAKQLDGNESKAQRDSLYDSAQRHARSGIQADSTDAEAYFMLAQSAGRLSRTRGGKERVRLARTIHDAAARALALDSLHDGALHVLGAWHAEVKRLSGPSRLFAKAFLGGGFLGIATWDSATTYLERSVALRPSHIYHRLELAEVYLDLGRPASAREQLVAIATLPIADVLDGRYQQRAAELLNRIDQRAQRN